MFTVGSKVVHPTCGAGIIVEIQDKTLGDVSRQYYVIETASKGRRLFVPVERGEAAGLHPVGDQHDLREALEATFAVPEEKDIESDYKARQQQMREELKSGAFDRVCEVVRLLYYLNSRRPLGTVDRSLLDMGKHLLASEYALAAEIDVDRGMRFVEETLTSVAPEEDA